MHPVICKIGPFTIYSYGLMFAIAVFVGTFLLLRDAKKQGLNQEIILDFIFWVLVVGIVGARIFYILFDWPYFKENPKEIFMLWHGGLVWYGGLIAAIVFGIFYLKVKKLAVARTLDLIIPYVALGQGIGRIGCFLNGCCFGRPSVFGLYFPVHQARLFPVQLLSSLNLFLIFFILKFAQNKSRIPAQVLFLYLLLASTERFIAEFFRNDTPPLLWDLTIFQFISLGIFIAALYGEIFLKSRRRV